MAGVGFCGGCGKLYNFEERPARIGRFNTHTTVLFVIRRDGAGRQYLEDIQTCPECSDKIFKYVQSMRSELDNPEYIPSEYSS